MPDRQRQSSTGRVLLGLRFADAARRYWIGVFPHVRRELSRLGERAGEIPDPVLRQLALDAQRKRGNLEGAGAFATFAPREERATVVRAAVAFQVAYDYLDVLAEQPQPDPVAGARALHEALLVALDPARRPERPDYYGSYPHREDGGYLAELVEECRAALLALPSYLSVAGAARRAAERIAEFQSLNLSEAQGEHDALARWAQTEIAPGAAELAWWEAAAAGGSPLCAYALIAAAAEPAVQPAHVEAIERAYHPWIGALHSLLDHLVDREQDAAAGERNLIDYYSSPEEAAARMRALAVRAHDAAQALPRGSRHAIILAGMSAFYLSAPEAASPGARPIAQAVRASIGGLATPALLVFKGRRFVVDAAAHSGSFANRRGTIPEGKQAPIPARARL
jgi:tetraprenyl-beta-curcumene synthase